MNINSLIKLTLLHEDNLRWLVYGGILYAVFGCMLVMKGVYV